MTSILDSTLTSSINLPHDEELPTCVRCKEDITTGHAYELGDDKWHTHCFSCYRCNKPLSCESDFLVLGTGTLICFDCSDSCKSCGKKIDDLAIILSSSNEAYCSGCFKCCKCGDKIKDLRYAKTKRGLFCLSCHERLLAKRKYYEEKKRRLTKHLPTIPKELQEDDDLSSPKELKVPERSRNRPISPERKGSNSNNSNSHKRNVSIDDMLKSTLAREGYENQTSEHNNDDVEDSSIDNLSLEPLENLENEGIIDNIIPQAMQDASPLLLDSEFNVRTSSNASSSGYKGGLYAEALNKPSSTTSESYGGLGITSASMSSNTAPDTEITPHDTQNKNKPSFDPQLKEIKSTNSPVSVDSRDRFEKPPKPTAGIEAFRMYKTPALDFSNSSTNLRRDFLNTDIEEYNEEEMERKIGASKQELDELENDIKTLKDIKQKLLDEVSSIEQKKVKLLEEVRELQAEKPPVQDLRNTSSEIKRNRIRPPPEMPMVNMFDSISPSKEQEHVASVARQAKPKFWKLFSSSNSPQKPNLMTKSSSSRGISNLGINGRDDENDFPGIHIDKLSPFSNSKMNKSGSTQSMFSEIKEDGSNLYGSTLVQRCQYERSQIPNIMIRCIENIECDEENLRSEGLYRKSGSQAVIENLEKKFSKKEDFNLADYDINVSTSILKRYLRKLPDPIITFQIYDPLISVVRTRNMTTRLPLGKDKILTQEDIASVTDILNQLPKEHIYLLKVLSVHLEKVMGYKDYNLMGLNNIALVFAPGLIRDLSGEKDILDMKERNYIIGFILEHYKQLFY
ncbi:similar to Saccharomyces cerevisiae YDR379W RGA2 GTPase-activating protein for the polarity-establishment protein Cdc42p [Maudiozyma saulgeensis]|uniref:Similar to Saccharomyces cerevisiae YDR379W RGA2 GTPase-activating protein for the polarity-establishment protein Cdc42p n=1 Tax=Maudiozyma saulgeensis TaxID=1789683 RepID=A0A1X7QXH9_9SACH|nr:similar to Saccharomyces cerevisiae YDR379W RGA2 GTPase-activating protein for the polarity-establishment protein Cdc42p [Kazachstania saulgeensis]